MINKSCFLTCAALISAINCGVARANDFIEWDDDIGSAENQPILHSTQLKKVNLCSGWEFSYPISMLPVYVPHYGTNGVEYHSANGQDIMRLEENASHLEIGELSPRELEKTVSCASRPALYGSDHSKNEICREGSGQIQVSVKDCSSIYTVGPLTRNDRPVIQIELCVSKKNRNILQSTVKQVGETLRFTHRYNNSHAGCVEN
jgi:hypothetical protein